MPRVKEVPRVVFDHPIEVQLAKQPNKFRVLGVKRQSNPNGSGSGQRSYAIAEWFFTGNWLRVNDLVQQMRLANTVEHGLGHNLEAYANVEGDKVLGETAYQFRIVYHAPLAKTHLRFPASSDDDSPEILAEQLDKLVADRCATGGDIEQYVEGIGWCIHTPEEGA